MLVPCQNTTGHVVLRVGPFSTTHLAIYTITISYTYTPVPQGLFEYIAQGLFVLKWIESD